jgi:hypothetical protein
MAKQPKKRQKKDEEGGARRKLADMQAKLQSAQEERSRVVAQAEQDVEKARQQAAAQVDKVTKEVERRAARVARAEATVVSMQSRKTKPAAARAPKSSKPAAPAPVQDPAASPEAAADRLEDIQLEIVDEDSPPVIVVPDGAPLSNSMVEEESTLNAYERRVLTTLREHFGPEGATYSAWLFACGMSKRNFLSARKSLVERGLVVHQGEGQGALYALTEAGSSIL